MRDGNGRVYVTLNDGEPAVPLGAELLTCDGQEVEELQRKWVDPYRWNLDVPHERAAASLFLMTAFDGDVPPYRACIFRADGEQAAQLLLAPWLVLDVRGLILREVESGERPCSKAASRPLRKQ